MKIIKKFCQNIIKIIYNSKTALSFLSLILFKINSLYVNIFTPVEMFLLIGIITFLGSSFFNFCGQFLMKTESFQWLLFHFFKVKNILYKFIDNFLRLFKELGQLGTFMTILGCSGLVTQAIWIFFTKTGFYFQLPLFIPMFFFSIFNLIEKMLIFNPQNILKLEKDDNIFSLEHAFLFLGIASSTTSKIALKKRETFPFIQKRYMSWKKEIPSYLKVILPFGASVGFGITTYFTFQDLEIKRQQIEIQKQQIEIQKQQIELQQKQINYQKEQNKKSFWIFW